MGFVSRNAAPTLSVNGARIAGAPQPDAPSATQRKIGAAFLAASCALVLIGVASCWSVARLREDAAWVDRTHQAIGAAESVLALATDVETAARGFTITGRDQYLQPYTEAVGSIDDKLAALRGLTVDDAFQQRRLGILEGLVKQRIGLAGQIIEARRSGGPDAARALHMTGRGKELHDAIRKIVKEMTDAEQALLTQRQARTDRVTAVALLIVAAGSALALLIVVAAQVLIRREFAAARRARVALGETNALLESRIAERTAKLERVNRHLSVAFEELRLLVQQAPLALAMFDCDMRYIVHSQRWLSEYGKGRDELVGLSHYDVHPDLPQHWIEVHRRCLAGEVVKHDEDMWVQADGARRWLRWAVSPWRNETGEIGGITMLAEDITQARLAGEKLRLADAVFRNTQEGIAVTDLDGNIVAVNPAFGEISEYSEAELIGQRMSLLHSGRQDKRFYEGMWNSILARGNWRGEVWDRRKNGEIFQQWVGISTVRDDAGAPTHYVGVFTDISRMRHAQTHLEHLAHHDALTGLPNRALLYSRLAHTVERARRESVTCAVVLLDLDGFKAVNDTYGHEVGDELLKLVGQRMESRLRDSDTLARLGGDEFVVVLERLSCAADAARIAQSFIERLGAPFQLVNGKEVRISGCAGISVFPANGNDAGSLIRSADVALYQAKAAGRGAWRLCDVES